MSTTDALFQEKNVFQKDMLARGIAVCPVDEKTCAVKKAGDSVCLVAELDFGACYVARFANTPARLCGTVTPSDPRQLACGEELTAPVHSRIRCLDAAPANGECDFICTPTAPGQLLAVDFGTEAPELRLLRYPTRLGRDTDDEWYRCGAQKDLKGNPDSWGNWAWTADEVLSNVYEPLRRAHPDYITRRSIGKDDTGTYDMWCYTFEPKDWEQTILVTGGMHASEMDGYLGLARFFELLVNEDGSNAGLHYLRTKVKIVLIPIINVYSASVDHIRYNGRGVDLNRDFGEQTQAETRNAVALIRQYKDEAAALIDYHTSKIIGCDLYYQFSIDAPNSALCRRVTNHIYEDLKARGLVSADPVDIHLVPGALNKQDKYLQGYCWNHFGIPTLVVEHEHQNYAEPHSALGLELAVDYYANFLIQTALAKLKLK